MPEAPQLTEASGWLREVRLPACLAVGWSGGADSTALLLALNTLGHSVRAWHIDHAWHEDSARQSEHLHRLAVAWGIPFFSARVRGVTCANREAEARRARMNQFEMWGREQHIKVLCLAHHLEDQAETVCLRMLQGAGAAGCRGMAGMRRQGELQVVRPLLHVHKCELECALRAAGVRWLSDPSNADTGLWRNRIRHRLFPAISRAGTDPVQLYLRWQRQAACVSALLGARADAIGLRVHTDTVSVDWGEWCDLPAAVRAVVLQRMAETLLGEGVVLGRRHIRLIERWRAGGARGGLDLSRSRISREHGCLNLSRRRVRLR